MNTTLETVDKEQLHSLLLRSWMTHDAMWLANTIREVGIERANKLNRAAVRDMAVVEAKRICKLIDLDAVRSFDDLRRFVEAATELVIPPFMDFTVEWSATDSSMQFEITECFAFDGVTMLGIADDYECGIYERIYGWLNAFELSYEVSPTGDHCLKHQTGGCLRRITIAFEDLGFP
ncbi:MAG: hypothetical protein GY708_11125 [Actinomycetia bacterium]|nr:hypothetical protein [Actinomycetes bacterium]MCP4084052.1 hypothetical protein [Actinomycetes bacterium]